MKAIGPGDYTHIAKGTPYREGNTPRAVDAAVERGDSTVDFDAQCSHGRLYGCHWRCPMKHDGFRDPLGKLKPSTRIDDMTPAEIERLRAPGGDRIHELGALIQYARTLDRSVEVEAKDPTRQMRRRETWDRLEAEVGRQGVIVKVTLGLFRKRRQLKVLRAAHRAGFTTLATRRGRRIPKRYRQYVDFTRG